MRNRARACLAVLAAVSLASLAWGQVESHMPSKQLPDRLMPPWVSGAPAFQEREVNATPPPGQAEPSVFELTATQSAAIMPDDAREVIRLAEGSQWTQAAEAGRAVLQKPLTEFDDYTWDYVSNATAWALVQTGKGEEASAAHTAAAARFRDNDLRVAHRLLAVALRQTEKKPAQLKKPDVYRGEVRASVEDRIEKVKNFTKAASESDSANSLIFRLSQAYGELRVLAIVDPALGKQLIEKHFKPAADVLVATIIPAEMKRGQAFVHALDTQWGDRLPNKEYGKWNATVAALWNQVREIKRICRIHHHLAGLDLADSREAAGLFKQAHGLLFVPGDKDLVWQQVGASRMVNGIGQKDLRRRVPWGETDIAPVGVAIASGPKSTQGWKKMDKMDGDGFQKMDGDGFKKMDGNGFKKMDGNGFKKMDGGGWKKMDGGRWRK